MIRANANAFDVAVLSWCKLFDVRDRHNWRSVVPQADHVRIAGGISARVGGPEGFDRELNNIKTYRDKFLAHLDEPRRMNYPRTEPMLSTTSFLYDALRAHAIGNDIPIHFPAGAAEWLERCHEEARTVFERLRE